MRICITGIGIVSALGIGKDANLSGLLEGKPCVKPASVLPTTHKEWPVGEVPATNTELETMLGISPARRLSRNTLLGICAAREALVDAGLRRMECSDMEFYNGTTVGGMDLTEQCYPRWVNGDTADLRCINRHPTSAGSRTIRLFTGGGISFTCSTACSSSLNALMLAADSLRSGDRPFVLAGGTEALTLFHLNGFAALGILSEQVCRPFQEDRDGINLGEGAAYLLLEREESALSRGAHIYAYLAGYANRCDAYHPTASSPDGDGAYQAMHDALQMAHLEPSQIDYINAHGTATPNNDASELAAIHRLFGEKVRFSSTKPLTGHTTSACGAIETVFCLMLMRHNGWRYVMNNAFAFGGNDSSLVLSGDAAELTILPQECRFDMTELYTAGEQDNVRDYISPMEARRLSPGMRALVIAAKKALYAAGVDKPDAIIVSTDWGGMKPTVELLENMRQNGESGFSPAAFMQSTQNVPATTLARILGCKGYNNTLSRSPFDGAAALHVARSLLTDRSSACHSVLLCSFDEHVEPFRSLARRKRLDVCNDASACIVKLK